MKIELFSDGVVLSSVGLDKPHKTEQEMINFIKKAETIELQRLEVCKDLIRVVSMKINELLRDLGCYTRRGDWRSKDRKEIESMIFYGEKLRLVCSLEIEKINNKQKGAENETAKED